MNQTYRWIILLLFLGGGIMTNRSLGGEEEVIPEEMRAKADWLNPTAFMGFGPPPFSFYYGEHHSTEFLKDWRFTQLLREIDRDRTERELRNANCEMRIAKCELRNGPLLGRTLRPAWKCAVP
jgi:hypothetical protein